MTHVFRNVTFLTSGDLKIAEDVACAAAPQFTRSVIHTDIFNDPDSEYKLPHAGAISMEQAAHHIGIMNATIQDILKSADTHGHVFIVGHPVDIISRVNPVEDWQAFNDMLGEVWQESLNIIAKHCCKAAIVPFAPFVKDGNYHNTPAAFSEIRTIGMLYAFMVSGGVRALNPTISKTGDDAAVDTIAEALISYINGA